MKLGMMVYCSLFTAFIIIGGYISIPIGPVPIVLADFFVMTAGLFLGFGYGLISTVLFVFLGAIGLPVFSGGSSGLVVILGPTGGYLLGYLLMVCVIGLISDKLKGLPGYITALIVGNIVLYAVGIPRLKDVYNLTWTAAIASGLTPFVFGMVVKIAAAAAMAHMFLPAFRKLPGYSEYSHCSE